MSGIQEWLKIPGNIEKYQKWLKSPITRLIIEEIDKESRPIPLPLNGVTAEAGLYLHGIHTGRNNVISRLKNLDAMEVTPEEIMSDYNVMQNLVEQGYEQKEAERIVEAWKENQ